MNKPAAKHTEPASFESKRIFFQSTFDGKKTGWYISVTSERAYGPFSDKQVAQHILDGLIRRLQEDQINNGDTGRPGSSGNAA